MRSLKNLTSRVQIVLRLPKTVLHPTKLQVDTRAGPNLINEDCWKPNENVALRVLNQK